VGLPSYKSNKISEFISKKKKDLPNFPPKGHRLPGVTKQEYSPYLPLALSFGCYLIADLTVSALPASLAGSVEERGAARLAPCLANRLRLDCSSCLRLEVFLCTGLGEAGMPEI